MGNCNSIFQIQQGSSTYEHTEAETKYTRYTQGQARQNSTYESEMAIKLHL